LRSAEHVSKELIGSKAKNLTAMLSKNWPVPNGFVITSQAFQTFMRENQVSFLKNSVISKEEFLSYRIPYSIEKEIEEQYKQLHQQTIYAVAVRSSSAFEDLQAASFAGQYETYLNIRSLEALLDHVKLCWYSYFSPVVQHYASGKNIVLDQLQMGVIVQGMVDADVSGVIFSKNPVTNNHNEIIINASFGLGEAVVSGEVTPDCFVFQKEKQEFMKEIGLKEIKMVPSEGGIETVPTTLHEQESFCLQDSELVLLIQTTLQIEMEYQSPVDIEFAFSNHRFYLLQVRPITT